MVLPRRRIPVAAIGLSQPSAQRRKENRKIQTGRNSKRTLPPEVSVFDHPSGEEGTGNPRDTQDHLLSWR